MYRDNRYQGYAFKFLRLTYQVIARKITIFQCFLIIRIICIAMNNQNKIVTIWLVGFFTIFLIQLRKHG